MLYNEIRINNNHTQLLSSEYEEDNYGGPITDEKSTPIIRKNITGTNSYLNKVVDELNSGSNEIIPPNCRYFEQGHNNSHLVVIEEPPAYRTIQVELLMDKELEKIEADGRLQEFGIKKSDFKNKMNRFTLAFPYVIFILMYDSRNCINVGAVYLRTSKMSGLADPLFEMPMLNISSDGYICFGDDVSGAEDNITRAINKTITTFWSAPFNPDYMYNYEKYRKVAGVDSYIIWQEMTKRDPMFIYKVDWIKQYNTIIERIEEIKSDMGFQSKKTIHYRTLEYLFHKSNDSGIDSEVRKGLSYKSRLYYDIATETHVGRDMTVNVGDTIPWGKNNVIVDSLMGFEENDIVKYIRLIKPNGQLFISKMNRNTRKFICDKLKTIRFSESGITKNGLVIKPGDIIVLDNGSKKFYHKVYYIRRAIDGKTEARFGNHYYILENVEASLFDMEKLTYCGEPIDKVNPYITHDDNEHRILKRFSECKFSNIDVTGRNDIKIVFEKTNDGDSTFYVFADNFTRPRLPTRNSLSKRDAYREIDSIFSIGREFIRITKPDRTTAPEGSVLECSDGITYNNSFRCRKAGFSYVREHILSNDHTHMKFNTFGETIDFKIGDKVVYADWDEPMNMLKVRQITSFVVDNESLNIKIILTDKSGNHTPIEYIKYDNSHEGTLVQTGKLRHITNAFQGIVAGSKIRAKEGYIPHFPKKDINIIIGFINDTGDYNNPLVLCSNCCTLWFSDLLEKFDIIPMSDPKWKTLQHASIDISKIKPQPGDIVTCDLSFMDARFGWVVCKDYNKCLRIANINSLRTYLDLHTLDTYLASRLKFNGIINPRVKWSIINNGTYKSGWPLMNGMIVESELSDIYFLEDERSFINV